jgi:hypothetical protein
MKVAIKAHDSEGNVVIEGTLNEAEMNYLLQFGINGLMAMGAQFALEESDTDSNVRINFGGADTMQ